MERLFLVPATGKSIPSIDHGRGPLPAEGGWVKPSVYWTNRLNDGDVSDDTKAQIDREGKQREADLKAEAAAAKAVKKEITQ